MTKVIVTAQVKNVDAWEKAFRTHGELFRSQGQTASPIQYGTKEGSEVAVCSEIEDLDAYRKSLESPEMIATMEQDGVKRDTLKVFVLDKDVRF